MAAKPRIVQLRRSKEWIVVCGSRILPQSFKSQTEALNYVLSLKK